MISQPREIELPSTDPFVIQQVELEFQNVLRLLGHQDLQPLRSRIQLLYNNFTEQVDMEKGHLTKCAMFKKDKDIFLSRISNCNKMVEDENAMAENYKKELEKKQMETQELRRKESDVKDIVARHKNRLRQLDLDQIKFRQDIQLKNQSQQNQLKKQLEVLKKTYDQSLSKLTSLRSQEGSSLEEIMNLQNTRDQLKKRIDTMSIQIQQIQGLQKKQKHNKEKTKQELDKKKVKKDELRQQKMELEERIKQLLSDMTKCSENLMNQKKMKDEQQRVNKKLISQKQQLQRDQNRKGEQYELKLSVKKEKLLQLQVLRREYQDAVNDQTKAIKLQQFAFGKKNEMQSSFQLIVKKRQQVEKQYEIEKDALEKLKLLKQKVRVDVNEQISKRMQSDKEYKSSQNKQHQMQEGMIELHNRLKKIMNEVTSYQAESEKLGKVVEQLKRQQEKYGIEASHAHARYYQTVEEVKIKNTQIQNLQKQNQEVENKSKHQQNLYETVRSDRNYFSKTFLKSKEEISELKKKYRRMTYEVEQLREQIKNKDQKVVQLDKEFRKIQSQNEKIKADKMIAVSKIQSNQEVIRNQQNHIAHVKKIIQEGESTKLSQQKDYQMVVNQRDILGTQLIKRNQEVAALYQKIKLSSSNLTKGELHYKKLQKQYNELQRQLAQLRNEHSATDQQVKCIEDLKAEVSFKQKELLNERAKVRALEDQLANPMNVHRWRKLEATDQDNYQRILKIQTLQRRLISKTEQVKSKENLIRQKEKLFLDLKNILSRQPGAQIHQQLAYYRDTLKQKGAHMKKMKKELEDAYVQVELGKHEVSRLSSLMSSLKKQYFQVRADSQKEVIQEDRNMMAQQMLRSQQRNESGFQDMRIGNNMQG